MEKGFSLLETLVAIGILTLAVLGPMTLASYSISSANLARNQVVAFNLASEAMEAARNKRDTNIFRGEDWLSGLLPCQNPNGCYMEMLQSPPYTYDIRPCSASCPGLRRSVSTGLFNTQSGEDTPFVRKITLTNISADEVKLKVEISWQEKSFSRSFILESELFRWH